MKKSAVQRGIVIAGLVLIYFLQAEIRFLPSPLMEELAGDFGVPLTMVGNLLSVCMVAAAVFMFGVSVVVEKLGSVNLLVLAGVSAAVCGLITGLAQSFEAALFACLFCGMSQGILECIGIVLVAQLFTEKYRALFCSGVCAVAQISSSAAYSLPVFLAEPLGGWRSLELLWSVSALAVAAVIFFFGGRKTIGRTENVQKEKAQNQKERPGLVVALRVRFILLSVAAMVVFIWVNNHYSIYLPTYLIEVKQFSKEQAGLAASLMYICGFSGALAAGIFSIKYRKFIYRTAPILMLAGALCLCLLDYAPGILFGVGIFGFFYQMWVPMAMASFMNLDGVTASVLAGATALFNGTGHFLTGFIPTVFTFELRFMSMQQAYLLTACFLIIPAALTAAAGRLKEFR